MMMISTTMIPNSGSAPMGIMIMRVSKPVSSTPARVKPTLLVYRVLCVFWDPNRAQAGTIERLTAAPFFACAPAALDYRVQDCLH